MLRFRRFLSVLALVLIALAGPGLWVGAASDASPEALAPPVAEALAGAVEVEADGVAVRVRPVRRVEPRDGTAAGLGIAFTGVAPGALLGAVTFDAPWTGYRGQSVPAGTYTLRYAVEPEDGYHMGVSLYRDFAILVPAAEDRSVAPLDEARLIELGSRTAGSNHPAVLALWPADGHPPGETFDNDLGQPTLVVEAGETTLGLVLAGTGEV